MIFLHETHQVVGGKVPAFSDVVRTRWRPLMEEHDEARLLWFWELGHGTGASYQVVSITAVRDWATWGTLVERAAIDPRWREASAEIWTLRREVTRKLLLPAPWSPLVDVDLAAPPAQGETETPALHLHDTGWPYQGGLEAYVEALGSIYYPQVRRSKMISVEACWMVAPGTGRHHEVVLLQKILDWPRFTQLLSHGEQGAQQGGWMVDGLRFREQWESKLLRCARWSPRQ